jgi:cell division protein FtsL
MKSSRPKRKRRRRDRSSVATNGKRSSSTSGSPPSTGWSRHGTALPSWSDLDPPKNRRARTHTEDGSFLRSVSTAQYALLVLVLAAAFTAYVGHVHATQQLLSEVQEARAANQSLHLKHNRLKGAFDRKTGPSVIYERARQLGLRESVTYGPTITVE